MLHIWVYTLLSVMIVSFISLIGMTALFLTVDKLKRVLFILVSFAAGALLGDVFIHLLPEIAEEAGFTPLISLTILGGIASLFIVEKIIHWHHYHAPLEEGDASHVHPFVFTNLIGDSIHNGIDGLIIGASYMVSIPVGIATTIAVILHEIPQEISDFALLVHGGLSKTKALFVNFLSALAAIAGAAAALLLGARTESITSVLIPFAAGSFIYIAGADLIPELHKELSVKKSIVQFVAFLLGIGMMILLLGLE